MGIEISPPAILSRDHDLTDFDCGNLPLNNWLKRFAWQNQKANAANTFVVCVGNRVIGFYSLAVGAVEPIEAPQRLKKGLARHPIPVMVLARLAVHKEYQGLKIGSDLLKDAIIRTLKVSEDAGIRAIVVHAKDEKASEFYRRFDFEPWPLAPLKLSLLLKDARKNINNET